MHFDWSPIPPPEWRALLARCPRANLLQSWPYAVAARAHDQMMSRRGRIVEDGETVGLMQIQEVKLGPIHVLKLHRGPLWLERDHFEWKRPDIVARSSLIARSRDFTGKPESTFPDRALCSDPDIARWRRFFSAFTREFPRRIGRWRHILPELDDCREARALLDGAGLRQKGPEPYRTICLDLQPDLDGIRKRFKSNWRNKLNQAERAGLAIICDCQASSAAAFLSGYGADKSARGYRGPAPARLATLIASASPAGEAFIFNAMKDDETIAAMLMFRHGHGATYQAGWTTEEGRKARAHHLLLWSAICRLKDEGVAALDLGGIHPRMAAGVTSFKQGLGGTPVTLVGIFG